MQCLAELNATRSTFLFLPLIFRQYHRFFCPCVHGILPKASLNNNIIRQRRHTMTPLRKRMIEDLQLRGMGERTQQMYVRAVRQLL